MDRSVTRRLRWLRRLTARRIDPGPCGQEPCGCDAPRQSGEHECGRKWIANTERVDAKQVDGVRDERPQPEQGRSAQVLGRSLAAHNVVRDECERREQRHQARDEEALGLRQKRDEEHGERTHRAFQEQRVQDDAQRWRSAAAREERSDERDVGWTNLLGRTRASERTQRRLVQELPSIGAIKSSNPCRLDDRGIKVAEIDPHPVAGPRSWQPVRYATTRCASTQPKTFITPHVAVNASLASRDLDLAWFVVSPQPSLAATDRAVATGKSPRLSRDLDSDCTAVASSCEHGDCPLVRPNEK